jgi:hypothetical protein
VRSAPVIRLFYSFLTTSDSFYPKSESPKVVVVKSDAPRLFRHNEQAVSLKIREIITAAVETKYSEMPSSAWA